jgi:hypothetical protein
MDVNALDKLLLEQDARWQQRLAQKEAEEASEKDEPEECDHKGKYRLSGNLYCAIRYCIDCGKSWRTWIKPEYNDVPLAEWEEIKEHMEVPPLAASFYDDPQAFVGDDEEDIDDEERPI